MAKEKKEKARWYRIDNAGVLYSSLQTDTYSAVYRFSVQMTQRVDPQVLQRAVDKTMPRFPSFNVRMKKGAFWYYFEPDDRPGPFVRPDVNNPCMPIYFRDEDSRLVRFYYYEHRISVECFHAVSDGSGALVFFRTLLAVYLRELGHFVPNGAGVLDISQLPRKEELEDSYVKYATGRAYHGGLQRKAYAASGTPEEFYTLNVTMGFLPLDTLRAKAREMGASVTEYLAAVLFYVLIERQKKERPQRPRPVALVIPVDLRAWFPSETLRNFILTICPMVDPGLGEYTFPELISHVHHYLRDQMSRPLMRGRFTGNVNFQRQPLLKLIPVFLKDPIMAFSYKLVGVRPVSTTYTNPGAFKMPPEMAAHVERAEVILGQPYGKRVNCASISFGNTMEITFAGTIKEADIEREFFRFLVREGIPVKVESNRDH